MITVFVWFAITKRECGGGAVILTTATFTRRQSFDRRIIRGPVIRVQVSRLAPCCFIRQETLLHIVSGYTQVLKLVYKLVLETARWGVVIFPVASHWVPCDGLEGE